jgi:hypothetical protein
MEAYAVPMMVVEGVHRQLPLVRASRICHRRSCDAIALEPRGIEARALG